MKFDARHSRDIVVGNLVFLISLYSFVTYEQQEIETISARSRGFGGLFRVLVAESAIQQK